MKPSTACRVVPSNGLPWRSTASTSSKAPLISSISVGEKHCRLMTKPNVSKWANCSLVNILCDSLPLRGSVYLLTLSDSDVAQVGACPLGDRQRLVERRRVHVLLDHRPTIETDVAQHVAKGQIINPSQGRLDEHIHFDCLGKCDVRGLDLLLHRAIDALDVQIGDALVVLAHKLDRIAAAVGMMAHIQTNSHPFRVGLLQECLYLLGILDVTLGMGMKNQLQAKLIDGDVGHPVGSCR